MARIVPPIARVHRRGYLTRAPTNRCDRRTAFALFSNNTIFTFGNIVWNKKARKIYYERYYKPKPGFYWEFMYLCLVVLLLSIVGLAQYCDLSVAGVQFLLLYSSALVRPIWQQDCAAYSQLLPEEKRLSICLS